MTEISPANIKLWSTVGMRATYGLAMLELAKSVEDLTVISADTSTSAGLDRFRKQHPDKFIDVGISEQNMIGIAAAMAGEGFTVFTSTFAPFQTLRCCEQIRVNLVYMGAAVKMVGLASGLVQSPLGYSHCCVEDIGVLRALGGITIISPADGLETFKAVTAAASYPHPVYIRLTGGAKLATIYGSDYKFDIGKAVTLRKGDGLTIISTGSMVSECLKAADLLASSGLSATVINMHTVNPLDQELLRLESQNSIFTVEEHRLPGGLGSAVLEFFAAAGLNGRVECIGVRSETSADLDADYKVTLEKHGLTGAQIAKRIMDSTLGKRPSPSSL